jgi:hypothetical protein
MTGDDHHPTNGGGRLHLRLLLSRDNSTVADAVRALVVFCRHMIARRPGYATGFLLAYLGNPLVFCLYVNGFYARTTTGDKWPRLLGRSLFYDLGDTGTIIMDPVLYVLITLPPYLAWLALNVLVLPRCTSRRRAFDVEKFLESFSAFHSVWTFMATEPFLDNFILWCGPGVGGLTGMFSYPLVMLGRVVPLVWWIVAIARAMVVVTKVDPLETNDDDDDDDDG